jgi:signal transduction histidine kinase
MKKIIIIFISIVYSLSGLAQKAIYIDSLKYEMRKSKTDTMKVLILAELSEAFNVYNLDSCLYYTNTGLELARTIDFRNGEALMLWAMGLYYRGVGDFPVSLKYILHSQQIANSTGNQRIIGKCYMGLAMIYANIDGVASYSYLKKAKEYILKSQAHYKHELERIDLNFGHGFLEYNKIDSAFKYLDELYKKASPSDLHYMGVLVHYGNLQFRMGNTENAIQILHRAIRLSTQENDYYAITESCKFLSKIYFELQKTDSAIYYAKVALDAATLINRKTEMIRDADLLAMLYEKSNIEEAFRYLKIANDLKETLYGPKTVQELQKMLMEEQIQQQKAEQERSHYEERVKQYIFLSAILVLAVIAYILYRNNQQKKKANIKLEVTLSNLKSTQSQLIQSEKMASLGELTAGIAHEIQNPLNFVNNFSEVNTELISELEQEAARGNFDEVKVIVKDIKENETKINLHGKRADAIVKGMLQHSRSSSGQKELTDINALCDEYLRLTYHGLRAKDKSFNAKIETDFDSSLEKINVVPQDIGRVVLNLINNAFYAVSEKSKQQANNYEPTVTVSTQNTGSNVLISVKDNGSGIPDSIKEKIFQPFFTTKPTGQGTGLGLSLSYDIVKSHRGELKIESKHGIGSVFIMSLPGGNKS